MMSMPKHSSRPPKQALRARDAGLRKVSVATRALVVGSVAAAGVFASMAAWAQPGRSKAARAANTNATQTPLVPSGGAGLSTATVPTTSPATVAPDTGGSANNADNLNPPATVPTQTPSYTPPSTQYTPPTYQYNPPAYQYTPPVVSGAS
jgi:hypothetical protein